MIAQQYRIALQPDTFTRPGYFVFENDMSSDVTGFVSKVFDDGLVEITLFEPKDLSNLPTLWVNEDNVDWVGTLLPILDEFPESKQIWQETLEHAQEEDDEE